MLFFTFPKLNVVFKILHIRVEQLIFSGFIYQLSIKPIQMNRISCLDRQLGNILKKQLFIPPICIEITFRYFANTSRGKQS